ncbi:E3 ubiquitin-protein ligase UBR3 [Apostasia shenzhenica]|uniref:E3 ubiquitin-protein ligase n=1 Tax=Apostasia shenzhenica TaxID=1088818 RepID=A0A2I0B2B3_9ASPA|nr:E3 ubiquitin-protein ligase UBR3 [Apostasia shenzhenica]
MAGMEIDSPSGRNSTLSPRYRIVQRLIQHGVPKKHLHQFELGLVAFLKDNKNMLPEILSSLLPTDLLLSEAQLLSSAESFQRSAHYTIKELFEESISWLQWLMFECDPQESLSILSQNTAGQRAVCGAVWGQNDLAYRCRTCENDPTCAICVPCFQNGNHKDHDYNIMYTGGGCCDCGDETAWKKEGFCSKHKGAEQIQPLPDDLANSIGPVLDYLLSYWKDQVASIEHQRRGRYTDLGDSLRKAEDVLSSAIVQMLLEFCHSSESLLSFISRKVTACSSLLDVLLKAERFLDKEVVKKLHELLLKLLGDPFFKFEFAKIFIQYYPTNVKKMIKDSSDSLLEQCPMLSTFSVQIFTVPTLTVRLVIEVDLLAVLLGCLKDLFLSFVDANGHLQASKWANMYETTIRLIEDVKYVLSHKEIPVYVARERPDISRTWILLLGLVQGMDSQKRVTGLHTEEENENLPAPFVLGHYLGNVNALLAGGVFSVDSYEVLEKQGTDDIDRHRHAKVSRISEGNSVCMIGALDVVYSEAHSGDNGVSFPSLCLMSECLKAIDCWLRPRMQISSYSSSDLASSSESGILALRKKLFRVTEGTSTCRVNTSMTRVDMDVEDCLMVGDHHDRFYPMASTLDAENEATSQCIDSMDISEQDVCSRRSCNSDISDFVLMDVLSSKDLAPLSILKLNEWPIINYDVSSEEISFHIPLHRLLSLLLQKALKARYHDTMYQDKRDATTVSTQHSDFFGKVLGGFQPCGFSAFIMEHPLQLRVFCAQVRGGMWRKNGDAAIFSSEWYRSVQWLEQGLESDLFLLQCCAALAPAESFVQRVLDRFGLSSYMSLSLADYNEYEAVLVQDMLTLIVHIVTERRFCGSSEADNLRRELVYRLAIGDATHSQLVKALPRDLSKSDKLQSVVDTLAVYCNPSGMKQGRYSLRKAFWKELDLYHPRWSSRDLQVAEERYFRFCEVSALNAQLPRWTPIFEPLAPIARIATSNTTLQIIRVVLFYALFAERSSISRAPDSVLITALHLVSLTLDACEAQQMSHKSDPLPMFVHASQEFDLSSSTASVFWKNQSMLSLLVSLMRKCKYENDTGYSETRQCNVSSLIEMLLKRFAQLSTNCLVELERLAPDIVCNVPKVNRTVQNLASTSDINEKKAKARQRQAAILEKMKAEQSKFIASINSNNNLEQELFKKKASSPELDNAVDPAPVCSLCRDLDSGSPLCFLILLQKSRLTSFVDRGSPVWQDDGPSNKELCSARKERLNDTSGCSSSSPFQLVQNTDIEIDYNIEPADVDVFLNFIRERIPDFRRIQSPKISHYYGGDSSLWLYDIENDIFQFILEDLCKMQSQTHVYGEHDRSLFGIADSTDSKVSGSVLGKYIACLSRKTSKQHSSSMYGLLHVGNQSSKSKAATNKSNRFNPKDCDGIHISSCGHAVHQDCHDRYLTSLKQRNIRRLGFEGGHIIDPDLGELLCPVCRRFANSILPAVPSASYIFRSNMKVSSRFSKVNVFHLPLALSLLQSADTMVGLGRFLEMLSPKLSEKNEPALEPAMQKLYMFYYPLDYNDLSASGRLSQSLVLWDTLRYSLVSTEIAARGRVRASSGSSAIQALYGELSSSSGFILLLLHRLAQSTRSSSTLEVLLRFRGIQLLVGSICFGKPRDTTLSSLDKRRGSAILENAEGGESLPDIHFWNRVGDPVLAHDPFSSLMWVLFCLPTPFMQSSEFFISLVHLFYTVCAIQVLRWLHS